jgi:glucosyl-3-phosphoglycerate synthase
MIQTFKYEDFLPLPVLSALKQQSHESISVIIPARNEESTIGRIVTSLRKLMDATGIIDEIIVMDDASEDATAAVARNAGANVVQVKNSGPHSEERGKGVALWKSQFVCCGTIIAFIDADLLDFDERFIIGLTGALLRNNHLELVKASYRRPLTNGSTTFENSGGRVTEILVRPLLNLFLPELADVHQPLGGEYAVRRPMLGKMHFYSGYGVEIGLLLEYYFSCGTAAIGQVDVGSRTHRNRELSELSFMSFEITQVFFNYLEQHGYCTTRLPRPAIIRSWESGAWKARTCEDIRLPPKLSAGGLPS